MVSLDSMNDPGKGVSNFILSEPQLMALARELTQIPLNPGRAQSTADLTPGVIRL